MKILVTCGCGFISSNLVRLLVTDKDESVVNGDKLTYAGQGHSSEDTARHPNLGYGDYLSSVFKWAFKESGQRG